MTYPRLSKAAISSAVSPTCAKASSHSTGGLACVGGVVVFSRASSRIRESKRTHLSSPGDTFSLLNELCDGFTFSWPKRKTVAAMAQRDRERKTQSLLLLLKETPSPYRKLQFYSTFLEASLLVTSIGRGPAVSSSEELPSLPAAMAASATKTNSPLRRQPSLSVSCFAFPEPRRFSFSQNKGDLRCSASAASKTATLGLCVFTAATPATFAWLAEVASSASPSSRSLSLSLALLLLLELEWRRFLFFFSARIKTHRLAADFQKT